MTRTTGQTTLQQTTKPKNIKTETSMSEQAPIREEGLSNEQVCITTIYVDNLVCEPNSFFPIYEEAIPWRMGEQQPNGHCTSNGKKIMDIDHKYDRKILSQNEELAKIRKEKRLDNKQDRRWYCTNENGYQGNQREYSFSVPIRASLSNIISQKNRKHNRYNNKSFS